MKHVTYSGYSFWSDGLSVWPSAKRKWLWNDLAAIRTAFSPQGNALVAAFVFRTGKTITLQAARMFSFGTGQGRFAELVAQAVAAAPDDAEIDELTFEIAQWGPREVRKSILAQEGLATSATQQIEHARHHRVWLETKRALKAVETALAQDRENSAAHALKHRLMLEQGKIRQARAAAEQWVACLPADLKAHAALQQLRLADNEPAAAGEATKLLEQDPGNEALAADLAAFHFRAGQYAEAAEVWRRFAEAAPNKQAKQRTQEMARYAEKTGSDAGFRRKETFKRWGRQTLAWTGVLMFVLLQISGLYTRCTREKREQTWREENQKQMKEMAEETKRRLEASDRSFTELTGRVMGKYAEVRERADKGEAAAQLTLADMLSDGSKGAPKDPVAAMQYLEKAVAQDHRAALLDLGQILVAGEKAPKDTVRAAILFERAMEHGSPRAAAELAELYEKGEGVPQDAAKAFTLYERAAKSGYVNAINQAGWFLERGKGVPADIDKALRYYRQSAEKKSEWAINRLIKVLSERHDDPAAQEEAWDWMKRAAKQGIAGMRAKAAMMTLTGYKEDAEVATDAIVWLEKAAASNETEGKTQLGQCLMNGWGMEQDFVAATELFAQDERKSETARALLARNLAFGVGCSRDLARAKDLLATLKDNGLRNWLEPYVVAADGEANSGEAKAAPFRGPPQYPVRLRRALVDGKVVLAFSLNQGGFVEKVKVVTSTHPEFAAAARLAVSFWRFKDGAPIGQEIRQTLEFHADEHEGSAGAKPQPD